MILKKVIQSIMNNKAKFILVWIVVSIIITLLAFTIGIDKKESVATIFPRPTLYTKGSIFWLPYYIADTGTEYYEGTLGVARFKFFSKYVFITPYYLFYLTILYWMLLSFVMTTICYLPIIRRYARNPDYAKTDLYP